MATKPALAAFGTNLVNQALRLIQKRFRVLVISALGFCDDLRTCRDQTTDFCQVVNQLCMVIHIRCGCRDLVQAQKIFHPPDTLELIVSLKGRRDGDGIDGLIGFELLIIRAKMVR